MRRPWPAALLLLLTACPEKDLDRARRLEASGALSEAGELYVDIAKADPANLAAWDGAVEVICRKSTKVGECLSLLDLELDRLGNVERHKEALAEVLELRARARIEQGLIDAALSDLDRAEKVVADRPTAAVARARAMFRAGRRAQAIAALEKAQRLDPNNPEIPELAKSSAGADAEGFGGTATTAR